MKAWSRQVAKGSVQGKIEVGETYLIEYFFWVWVLVNLGMGLVNLGMGLVNLGMGFGESGYRLDESGYGLGESWAW